MHLEITSEGHFAYSFKNQIFLCGRVFSENYAFPKKMLHYKILHFPDCMILEFVFYILSINWLLLLAYPSFCRVSLFRVEILAQSISGASDLPLSHYLSGYHIFSTNWIFLDNEEGLSGFCTYCVTRILKIRDICKEKPFLPHSLCDGFSHSCWNSGSQHSQAL